MGVYLNQYQLLPIDRTRELMEDLFGCSMSAEVLQQSSELCYENLHQKVEKEIKDAITESPVMHNDETGIRCEGKTQWIHVSSTGQKREYTQLVKEGIQQEPLPPAAIHKRGRKAKSKSLKLLECFRDKKKEYLGFLYTQNIPFDNNLAERDLRMVKLKQKISGCFKTRKGAEIFCRIRSYISTLKKQEENIWEALQLSMKTSSLHPVMIRGGGIVTFFPKSLQRRFEINHW